MTKKKQAAACKRKVYLDFDREKSLIFVTIPTKYTHVHTRKNATEHHGIEKGSAQVVQHPVKGGRPQHARELSAWPRAKTKRNAGFQPCSRRRIADDD